MVAIQLPFRYHNTLMFRTGSENIQKTFKDFQNMTSTKDLAAKWNVTPQAINRYRRKAEEEFKRSIGTADRLDARIIIYTSEEVAMIEHFIPPKLTTVQVVTEPLEPQSSLFPITYQSSGHAAIQMPAFRLAAADTRQAHAATKESALAVKGTMANLMTSIRAEFKTLGKVVGSEAAAGFAEGFQEEVGQGVGEFSNGIGINPAQA